MFDAPLAFKPLSGKTFAFEELLDQLQRIRTENLHTLPVEYETRDLWELGVRRGWIRKEGDRYLVEVSPSDDRALLV